MVFYEELRSNISAIWISRDIYALVCACANWSSRRKLCQQGR